MISRKWLKRLGCAVLLIPWLLCLSAPCLIIALVVQQEVVITYSDLPNDALRIWTIEEPASRGIAVANSYRVEAPNGATCVITDVRFFLWQGSALPSHQCACYTRQATTWQPLSTGAEACKLSGEPAQ